MSRQGHQGRPGRCPAKHGPGKPLARNWAEASPWPPCPQAPGSRPGLLPQPHSSLSLGPRLLTGLVEEGRCSSLPGWGGPPHSWPVSCRSMRPALLGHSEVTLGSLWPARPQRPSPAALHSISASGTSSTPETPGPRLLWPLLPEPWPPAPQAARGSHDPTMVPTPAPTWSQARARLLGGPTAQATHTWPHHSQTTDQT